MRLRWGCSSENVLLGMKLDIEPDPARLVTLRSMARFAECTAVVETPQQGDVRLVDLAGPGPVTQTCNEVHYGGVEVFNRGRWGAVCAPGNEDFTREATVICSQLGFPFGSMFEVREAAGDLVNGPFPPPGDAMPSDLAWTSRVTCGGGTEPQLEDCTFAGSSDGTLSGLPAGGVNCATILGVVCHRFEITGVIHSLPTTHVLVILALSLYVLLSSSRQRPMVPAQKLMHRAHTHAIASSTPHLQTHPRHSQPSRLRHLRHRRHLHLLHHPLL